MGPIVRILARVIAGILIGAGYFNTDATEAIFNDPAFDLAIGTLIWASTEGFYWLAKKFGWQT